MDFYKLWRFYLHDLPLIVYNKQITPKVEPSSRNPAASTLDKHSCDTLKSVTKVMQ